MKYIKTYMQEDRMIASFGYMSFTRNPLLTKAPEWKDKQVRITFDGDDMSNKFRFEPFMYGARKNGYYEAEREERINLTKMHGIKKYVLQAEVIKPKELSKSIMTFAAETVI